ncbi:hypothetical protein R2601_27354 [Salipiger bermudensis HTCC2601]|uniref:Uncharacterized protein n=1 Tax=Salipiger bermudensis (strain DSM 26914 / JCM 13377 / KCTC 12554 / HTCC2601) TaxID=314265 RepID=Q0FGW3_SALBH|nr:hypothetical protein R2601_27354 [Salipiger bermudensis HTCC2601]
MNLKFCLHSETFTLPISLRKMDIMREALRMRLLH